VPKKVKEDVGRNLSEELDGEVSSETLRAEIKKLKEHISHLEGAHKDRKEDPGYFAERLTEEVARSGRYKYEFCLLFMEIDNLAMFLSKQSDEVAADIINMMDKVLRDTLRTADLKCQCAPGSFGIILPYTDPKGGLIAAEKVRQTVERTLRLKGAAIGVSLTVSAGLASYPKDAMSPEHLGDLAKGSMSRAQVDGGNRVYMSVESMEGARAETEKQNKLSNDTFFLALDNEVMRCARFGQKFSLMLLEVAFPESKGTKIDETVRTGIMRAVFKLVNANVRTIDKVHLHSDKKFAVILPHTGPDGTLVVAQKLLQSLTSNPVLRDNGLDVNISINVGMSTFPTDEVAAQGLLRKTEEALCHAKNKGSNQIELAADVQNLSCKHGRNIDDLVVKVKEVGAGAIYSLLAAVDVTEHYDHAHSQAVAKYAIATGLALSLPNMTIRRLRLMALMHDLGKACIPESVLVKPGPLDDSEWDMMMKHPQLGANLLQQLPEFAYCCAAITAHHERPDGKGYPKGLKGDLIPLESAIIAVSEAYDDMTTPRPYRQQVLPAEALEELKKQAGAQFNANVVGAFVKALYTVENRLLK
jgi:diguanylate cyclase (GGDEF)-like protein